MKKIFSLLLVIMLLTGCDKTKVKEEINEPLSFTEMNVSKQTMSAKYKVCDINNECVEKEMNDISSVEYINIDFIFKLMLSNKNKNNFSYDVELNIKSDTINKKEKYTKENINLLKKDFSLIDDSQVNIEDSFKLELKKYYNEMLEYYNDKGYKEEDISTFFNLDLKITNDNNEYYKTELLTILIEVNNEFTNSNGVSVIMLKYYPDGEEVSFDSVNICNNLEGYSCTCGDVDYIANLLLQGQTVDIPTNSDIKISKLKGMQYYNQNNPEYTDYTISCGSYSKTVRVK